MTQFLEIFESFFKAKRQENTVLPQEPDMREKISEDRAQIMSALMKEPRPISESNITKTVSQIVPEASKQAEQGKLPENGQGKGRS